MTRCLAKNCRSRRLPSRGFMPHGMEISYK